MVVGYLVTIRCDLDLCTPTHLSFIAILAPVLANSIVSLFFAEVACEARVEAGTVICETHRHGNTDRRLYFVCAISPYDPSRLSRAVFVSFVGVCPGLYSSRVSRQLESRFLLIITTTITTITTRKKRNVFPPTPTLRCGGPIHFACKARCALSAPTDPGPAVLAAAAF